MRYYFKTKLGYFPISQTQNGVTAVQSEVEKNYNNIKPLMWRDFVLLGLQGLKRFLSKSKGCRVVISTTGPQCNLTRNKHGMVTRLTC